MNCTRPRGKIRSGAERDEKLLTVSCFSASEPHLRNSVPEMNGNALVPVRNVRVPMRNAQVPGWNARVPASRGHVDTANLQVPTRNAPVPTRNARVPKRNARVPCLNVSIRCPNVEIPGQNGRALPWGNDLTLFGSQRNSARGGIPERVRMKISDTAECKSARWLNGERSKPNTTRLPHVRGLSVPVASRQQVSRCRSRPPSSARRVRRKS